MLARRGPPVRDRPRLQRRYSAIDFLRAQEVIPESMEDPDVLALAASLGRVLVSHDHETMPGHFYRFLEKRGSPGLILVPQVLAIGSAIEEVHVAWATRRPTRL